MSESSELGDLFEFWTPGEIKEYIANVAAGYTALASDFKANAVLDGPNQKAWQLLYDNFLAFQKSVGFFSAMALGTLRTAEQYATQLKYWRDVYQTRAGKNATGASVDIPGDAQTATMNTLVTLAGAALAAWVAVNAFQYFKKR